jgi:hypothetical protein
MKTIRNSETELERTECGWKWLMTVPIMPILADSTFTASAI